MPSISLRKILNSALLRCHQSSSPIRKMICGGEDLVFAFWVFTFEAQEIYAGFSKWFWFKIWTYPGTKIIHIGQFLQDGTFGCFVSNFHKEEHSCDLFGLEKICSSHPLNLDDFHFFRFVIAPLRIRDRECWSLSSIGGALASPPSNSRTKTCLILS